MNKKHYAQPTLKVVELDMADIVCNSPDLTFSNNAGLHNEGGGTTNSDNRNRANGRGIWGED